MDETTADVTGSGGADILQSDSASSNSDGAYTGFAKLMGSIGTVLTTAGKTARDAGTVVGTVKRDLKSAPGQYVAAQQAAENPSVRGRAVQFWTYATPTDKAMLILAAVGVALAVYSTMKGK